MSRNRIYNIKQFPPFVNKMFWCAFRYLTKYGKRKPNTKMDENKFTLSVGTVLMRMSEKMLLSFCRNNLTEYDQDIPIKIIQPGEATPEYMKDIVKQRVPILIKGGASHWPAMSELSLEMLEEKYGEIEVPAHAEPNITFPDNGKPVPMNNFYQMENIKFKEVITSVRNNGVYSVKAIEDILHLDGENLLKKICDIDCIQKLAGMPDHIKLSEKEKPYGKVTSNQINIQTERSHTPWHCEVGTNFFVGIAGKKLWRLAPPEFSIGMYPIIKNSSVFHVSRVDGRESNQTTERRGFPLYKFVPKFSAVVEKGDILLFPNYWWHTVSNLPGSHTISVTFRTLTKLGLTAKTFEYLRLRDPQAREMIRKYAEYNRVFDDELAKSLYTFADEKNDLR